MSAYDYIYNELVEDVLLNGVYQKERDIRAIWKDGTKANTKFLLAKDIHFDNKEVPILTTKEFLEEEARLEMDWIWVKKSNIVQELREMGSNIWNKWEIKEGPWAGTIGPAYGFQLGRRVRKFPVSKLFWEHLDPRVKADPGDYVKNMRGEWCILLDQVDYLIQTLLNNPGSRQNILTLWVPEFVDEMGLPPCVWNTNWATQDNVLNLIVGIRSNDLGLGNPFNMYQYHVLQRMMCQITGLELGFIHLDLGNAHVYDRHIPSLMEQIRNPIFDAPTLEIDKSVKTFYEFDQKKHFELQNYNHGPRYKMPLAQ